MCMERLSRSIEKAVRDTHWTLVKISTRGPTISHLFFSDDLCLFGRADMSNSPSIRNIIRTFCGHSNERMNYQKSKSTFSRNCSALPMKNCSNTLGIRASKTFRKHLCFPIFQKRATNNEFQFIIDNMRKRLAGWKTKFLNLTRCTVLS